MCWLLSVVELKWARWETEIRFFPHPLHSARLPSSKSWLGYKKWVGKKRKHVQWICCFFHRIFSLLLFSITSSYAQFSTDFLVVLDIMWKWDRDFHCQKHKFSLHIFLRKLHKYFVIFFLFCIPEGTLSSITSSFASLSVHQTTSLILLSHI